ncbi:hypothetical protein [Bacillus phage Megatron]|uniref:Lipoprotein n=2 Tax=Wphvirus megatron TaxID=1987728 RepID=A0A024B2Q1_9CAUD|nr:hypothetical protein FP75_gp118 [Bacillus phage Megatron]YP_009280925.1 hypothetical protein SAGEFAYGE_122 [Bacillus phage SageFayge]AHZ10700.1 hypothetical protein [Bacillus phage Megatron]AMW63042.1 hypothetical protein SAGEFAYGE_122 [Bacillus phage SageFayge]
MKKGLAALALTSTLLVGAITGCAASKSEDKPKEKTEKTAAEKRGVDIWAMKGTTEVHYEGKDIKDYYRSNKSGTLVITFKNGKEVVVTNYHLEEEHPNAE